MPTLTPMTFTPGGHRLVYSNHPEAITASILGSSGVYTIETTLLPNYPYIHDFYHHNQAGGKSIIVGVAVKNVSGANTVKLNVGRATLGTGASGSGKQISAEMHRNYNNKSEKNDVIPVYINKGATVLIAGAHATIGSNKLLNGRVSLTAAAAGLKSRIVAIPTSTSVNSLFSLPRAANDGMLRTTAEFRYGTRYANINMNIPAEYKFCGRNSTDWQRNVNEFPSIVYNSSDPLAGTNALANGNGVPPHLCDGNFSVYYNFNLLNKAGKYITIKPGFDTSGWYAMDIGNGWVTQQISQSTGLRLNCKDISNIQFVLTGGNTGDIRLIV